ncbi:---NA---, partial [Paramuricea clavata]
KPEINMDKTYKFQKGTVIDCAIKRANPPEVNYTWYSCDIPICSERSWKFVKKYPTLQLASQLKPDMKYKCEAKNAAGTASKIIDVFKPVENTSD